MQHEYPRSGASLDASGPAASEVAEKQLTQLLKRIGDSCESMEGFQNKNNHVKLMLYFDDTPELSMESNKGVIRRG